MARGKYAKLAKSREHDALISEVAALRAELEEKKAELTAQRRKRSAEDVMARTIESLRQQLGEACSAELATERAKVARLQEKAKEQKDYVDSIKEKWSRQAFQATIALGGGTEALGKMAQMLDGEDPFSDQGELVVDWQGMGASVPVAKAHIMKARKSRGIGGHHRARLEDTLSKLAAAGFLGEEDTP